MPRTDSSYFNWILRSNSSRFAASMDLLDEDGYSDYVYESFSSDDITYNASDGKLTFSKAGTYEVTFSQILTNVASDTTTEFRVYTTTAGGTETMVYRAPLFRDSAYDPVCNVYRTIVSIEAGGKLRVATQTGQNVYMHAGSTMVVNRLTGQFGRVHLSASTRPFNNINPFTASMHYDSTILGGAGGVLTDGVEYNYTHGRLISSGSSFTWDFNKHGTYAVAFNGIFGTGTIAGVTVTASQNDVEFYNTTGLNINTHDPGPIHNFHILRRMQKDDYISLFAQNYNTSHALGAGTSGMEVGTTFAVYEIPNFAYFSATIAAGGTVNNGDSLGIAADTEKNVWKPGDTDVWAGIRSGSITVHADSPYVDYDPSNGNFTAKRSGIYQVNAITKIRSSSTFSGILTKRLYVNGAVHISGTEEHIYLNSDKYNHAVGDIITLLSLSAGDAVHVTHESSKAFKFGNGSCMTIFQVGTDWKYKHDDFSDGFYHTPVEIIDDEFTINTYATGSKSMQHNRDVIQPPFITSTPGPLSLRGKVEVDRMASTVNRADAERYLFTKK